MKLANFDQWRRVQRRTAFVFVILVLCSLGLMGRLVYLQIVKHGQYSEMAFAQRMRPRVVDPQRGSIYDRNYKTLAMSIGADAVYAIPTRIGDPQGTAQLLAPYLSLSAREIEEKLRSETSSSVWLARKLTPEQARAVRDLKLPGIYLVERPQRYYPNGTLAAHVLGITGIDNQGLEGLEYYYDEYLRGTPGRLAAEADAAARLIPGGDAAFQPPVDGLDLILALDSVIQHIAESQIRAAVEETKSERGVVMVMDPHTGEILASAVYPAFDPNNYSAYPMNVRRNIAITDQYEPGSTFKFVTAAAALEIGIASEGSMFYSGSSWQVGGGTIRNWDGRGSGNITFRQALERSDNIVFAQLAVEMGPERFYPIIRGFGLGSRLGVDFPGEGRGSVVAPGEVKYGETIRWATMGFGQGGAVTPLQLLTAICAVANDGIVMRPRFVREIRDSHGRLVEKFEPEPLGRALSESTAKRLSSLLRSVVVNGGGSQAEIPGYYSAGKTGTAEVPEAGGYGDERISSFVGYAPADDPALAALVILYKPQTEIRFGSVLAAPVFREVMEQSLNHLGIERRDVR